MFRKYLSAIQPRHLFILGCLALIFFAALKTPYDPDMGWHLQNGRYLLTHNFSFPQTDIYGYTMPNYPLIMHEWLTDVLMHLIYQWLSFWGLGIFFALVTSAAFFIAAKSIRARPEYQIIASLIGAIASFTIVGIRPQVITLFFLSLVVYLLYRFIENPQTKKIYWLPLVFLAWANLHGGFVIGLFTLVLFLAAELCKIFVQGACRSIKQKIVNVKLSLSGGWIKFFSGTLVCGLATLINPYGWRIYQEFFNTISDASLKTSIAEWYPVSLNSSQSYFFIIYLGLTVLLGLLLYKKLKFTPAVMFLVFVLIGFSSWRNMPLFVIFSIPLWVYFASGLVGETLSKLISSKLVLALLFLAVAVSGCQQIAKVQKSNGSVQAMSQYSEYKYPYQAVQYIKSHPMKGKMLNMYNWGGYLIWQVPEYKVFIDGRMPSWRQGGFSAMEDFKDLLTLQPNWEEILGKYQINWAILNRQASLAVVLAQQGWDNVYMDEMAVILVKPN